MTARRPPHLSWESFAEQQIREAYEAGQFDALPGLGGPLPDLGDPADDLWWVKRFLKRHKLSVMPQTLELAREVHAALEEILRLGSEAQVRRAVEELNTRILRKTLAATGPGMTGAVDVESIVARWRQRSEQT